MGKSYFIFGFAPTHPEDQSRVSAGDDYHVSGGSKAIHEKQVEIAQEISREFRKDPPQTDGEARMILLDVVKKVK
jgi:hypothetical protein